MNMTLEQLLTVRSSRDLCHKELDLNMELVVHLNEVQTTKAIILYKVCGTTVAYTLQKAHQESVLGLECQAMEEERWACQAFVEAFGSAMGSCSPRSWGHFCTPYRSLPIMCH